MRLNVFQGETEERVRRISNTPSESRKFQRRKTSNE